MTNDRVSCSPMAVSERLYSVNVCYDVERGVDLGDQECDWVPVGGYRHAGTFTLNGMMDLIRYDLEYHDGYTPTYRVFVEILDMPMSQRSMDEPHFTIHCLVSDDAADIRYTLDDDPKVMTEGELRDVITRKYDPEDYM